MRRLFSDILQRAPIDFRGALYKSPRDSIHELYTLSQHVAAIQSADLTQKFGKEDFLSAYFQDLSERTRSTELSDMVPLMVEILKHPMLRDTNYTQRFWLDSALMISKQASTLDFALTARLIHSFGFIKVSHDVVYAAQRRLVSHLEEAIIDNPTENMPGMAYDALWAVTSLNIGSPQLYSKLSKIVRTDDINRCARVASFLTRSYLCDDPAVLVEIQRMHNIIESLYRLQPLEDQLALVHSLSKYCPNSALFDELLAYLKENLNPKEKLSYSALFGAFFGVHRSKNTTLNSLLGGLVIKRLNECALLELCKMVDLKLTSSQSAKVMEAIVNRFKELKSNYMTFNDFTKCLSKLTTTKYPNSAVWRHVVRIVKLYFQEQLDFNDHYVVKIATCLSRMDLIDRDLAMEIVNWLCYEADLNMESSLDMVRCAVLLSQCAILRDRRLTELIEQRIYESIHYLTPMMLAWCSYALARVNIGQIETYQLIEKRLLDGSFNDLTSIELAAAAFAFTEIGLKSLPSHAVFAINNVLRLVVEDFQTEGLSKALEDNEINAVVLVQMCWAVAAVDYFDVSFWSPQLIEVLSNIKISPTFKHEVDLYGLCKNPEKFDTVDLFHGALLIQTLAVVPGGDTLKKRLVHIRRRFANCKEAVNEVLRPNLNEEELPWTKTDSLGLNYTEESKGQRVVFVDNCVTLKRSLGFTQTEGGLLTSAKLQLHLAELQGLKMEVQVRDASSSAGFNSSETSPLEQKSTS